MFFYIYFFYSYLGFFFIAVQFRGKVALIPRGRWEGTSGILLLSALDLVLRGLPGVEAWDMCLCIKQMKLHIMHDHRCLLQVAIARGISAGVYAI